MINWDCLLTSSTANGGIDAILMVGSNPEKGLQKVEGFKDMWYECTTLRSSGGNALSLARRPLSWALYVPHFDTPYKTTGIDINLVFRDVLFG